MTGSEYQKNAEKTAAYPKGTLGMYYLTMGLVGEAAEVSNKMKKVIRDHDNVIPDTFAEMIKAELGDVLWYIAMLSKELNMNLDDIMESNIKKLASRQERNVLQGNGDNR